MQLLLYVRVLRSPPKEEANNVKDTLATPNKGYKFPSRGYYKRHDQVRAYLISSGVQIHSNLNVTKCALTPPSVPLKTPLLSPLFQNTIQEGLSICHKCVKNKNRYNERRKIFSLGPGSDPPKRKYSGCQSFLERENDISANRDFETFSL